MLSIPHPLPPSAGLCDEQSMEPHSGINSDFIEPQTVQQKLPARTWELWLDASPPKTEFSWLKSDVIEFQ